MSIPELGKEHDMNTNSIDFWKILGIHDEFDIRHIISEVERFCSLYSIRNSLVDTSLLDETGLDAATAGLTVSPLHNFLGPGLDVSVTSTCNKMNGYHETISMQSMFAFLPESNLTLIPKLLSPLHVLIDDQGKSNQKGTASAATNRPQRHETKRRSKEGW